MNLSKSYYILFFILFCNTAISQNHYPRFEEIDVQHYKFEIHLNDTTNKIEGTTTILVKFLQPSENVIFDFVNTDGQNNGMSVEYVRLENQTLKFTHSNNLLNIELNKPVQKNETLAFTINYSGVPADGLVISENKYGQRTFFGDNWPDRAKNWLPCVDHPSDKATLEFLVYAPEHYEVISNGFLVEKKTLEKNVEFTHWKEDVPLSTKLMVIGVADFAIGNKTAYKHIPVSSWVFPENAEKGFSNYKYGTEALSYFSELIGPYSYEKLAHVQSKTRYGGMENASCIFYFENSATAETSQERLFAHEVAHQWFGNSVTEQNWHHVWLSEGFATYLTHVYMQHFYGDNLFKERMNDDRDRVISYSKRNLAPIIDTTVTEYIRLLNANSYQKASWVLHMLRNKLGDEIFFQGLREYYSEFRNLTALTRDFQDVMENVSGEDLDKFFNQWLWQAGHPILNFTCTTNEKEAIVKIEQIQDGFFDFPIEVKIIYGDHTSETKSLEFHDSIRELECTFDMKPGNATILLDPQVKLLFESKNKQIGILSGTVQ